ncbi:uncharacterized protein LOC128225867 [Mya arenaria]|uniref:uncharacterized protein LOC128225867 n=1 Tax=Mya arenaria TaxID=6604 RepID=UPI0022E5FE53|nr:uncharacterized protein LOC128225867 [Mya arenaria]
MKTQILFLVWFSIQVILSDRDLLQQPDITANITSSPYYDTWSPGRILSDISQDADSCNCCAAIIVPGYIDIDLMHPYSVYQIVILGRTDQENGVQFQNISFSTNNGHSIPVANKTNTYLSTIINPRQLIQMIRISSHQNAGVMSICNVKVYGREYLTGISSQSSVYATCTAERALNGIEDYGTNDIQLCQACSVTNNAQPWWHVDLGGEHLIRRIQVIGRDNLLQSRGLRVSIANALVGTDFVIQGNVSVLGLDQQISPPRLARSINITSVSGTNYMVLCEVKISETDCPIGTYGDKCAESCGHCRGGTNQCDYVNGTCKMGCETGYVGLPCLQNCPIGTYGDKCAESCGHCRGGTNQCDYVNGTCKMGCETGYAGLPCLQSCNSSYYGENCAQRCGNCLDGIRCDLKNGSCQGKCSPGYLGLYCNQSCNSSYYGESCSQRCGNCLDGTRCDLQNGNCPVGCSAGHSGVFCNQSCNSSNYGENCAQLCGYCIDGSRCDLKNGSCPVGCLTGYRGIYCNQSTLYIYRSKLKYYLTHVVVPCLTHFKRNDSKSRCHIVNMY